MRIAILETDRSQAFMLQQWLTAAGHVPHRYESGGELIRDVEDDGFDALLLNWSVPDSTGIEVLSHIRREMQSSVPVVLITSRTGEEDVVQALAAGADDYIAKPLRHRELLARLESVTRRTRNLLLIRKSFQIGRLRVDVAARRIFLNNMPVDLSAKDFDLAVFFLSNVGRLFSRSRISEAVWGSPALLRSRTLDTHVSRVRTKLWLTEANGWRLGAIYGQGYRLERLTATRTQLRIESEPS
jgi:DNA-binding response OmpR family regulator